MFVIMTTTRLWRNSRWRQPNGDIRCRTQVPDHTDWHNIIMWRGLAKVAEKYVHKGDRIYVEGRLRYRSYDDQKGQRRYVTEILADNMELLSTRHDTDAEKKTAAQSDERKETANDTKSPLPF